MKKSFILLFALLFSMTIFSQTDCPTINGRLVEAEPKDGDTLMIMLQIKLNNNQSAILGHAFNIKLNFNKNALNFIWGTYINFNSANGYETQPIENPGNSHIIQNIETEKISGNGQYVNDVYIDFVLIKFEIIDYSEVPEVCFHYNANGFKFYSFNSNERWNIGEWICYEGYVPVELTSLTANQINNKVELNWTTSTELNNSGFNVERNGENIGFIPGFGTSTENQYYSFSEIVSTNGIYTYRLIQVDYNGTTAVAGKVSIDVILNKFSLEQNYPNPFNPITKIGFYLNKSENVRLTIYDILGREVEIIADGFYTEGYNEIVFNANDLSSGLYIYQLQTENTTITKKMTLLK